MSKVSGPLFIVDTSTDGHHLTYLRMISEIFSPEYEQIVLLCPYSDNLNRLLATPEFDSIQYLPWQRKLSRLGRKLVGPGLFTQWDVHRNVRKWLKEHNHTRSVVHVFFACFDSFLFYSRLQCWAFSALAPFEYSGIILGAACRPDEPPPIPRMLRCRQIKSVLLLNELTINSWRSRGFDKARWLPDVSPVAASDSDSDLCREIVSFANGRRILLVFGRINPRKRVGALLRAFEKSNLADRLCIVVVGVVRTQGLTDEDSQMVRDCMVNGHSAIMVRDTYIADEEDLNAVVSVCDVVFAHYNGYLLSSNALFKTASLGKAVITSPSGVVGHRMKQHSIGWTVPDNSEQAICDVLERVAHDTLDGFQFEAFIREHDPDRFVSGIRDAFRP